MPSIAEEALRPALDALAQDGLVAFPTETVWGLAARAESHDAMERLRAFKGRDADKPVSVLIDGPERLEALAAELSPAASELAERYWPGPLTLVARCHHDFAPGVVSEGGVGFRCSPHPVASALARAALDAGLGPLTATSLNESGQPPAANRGDAERVCASDPSVVLAPGESDGALPSTVVDARGDVPRVLREGAIASPEIHAFHAPAEAASR